MPFATWMGLEIIILSEVSQTEKDKHHMISLICGIIFLIIKMNLFTKQKHEMEQDLASHVLCLPFVYGQELVTE